MASKHCNPLTTTEIMLPNSKPFLKIIFILFYQELFKQFGIRAIWLSGLFDYKMAVHIPSKASRLLR